MEATPWPASRALSCTYSRDISCDSGAPTFDSAQPPCFRSPSPLMAYQSPEDTHLGDLTAITEAQEAQVVLGLLAVRECNIKSMAG